MREAVLQARGLSKQFRIARKGRGDMLDRIMDRLFGRRARRETFWALKNVTFDVFRGENFGIVGPNGAGKSTLLKIISRIYKATSGDIVVRGRVIPFLELGWGLMEGQQTGAVNIYFTGTLFGLTRGEIDAAFDDIVKFAGLEQYLHTPLKYYSTGMKLRLTFAVALFSRPEIFLVDEILAVGDIAFRQKCYDALRGVQREEMTLLFVSHDLPAMREFCDRGIFINDGRIAAEGDIDDVIEEYMLGTWARSRRPKTGPRPAANAVDILDVKIKDAKGRERRAFQPWEPVDICIDFRVNEDVDSPNIHVQASGENGEFYFGSKTPLDGLELPLHGHKSRATLSIPHLPLLQGRVLFTITLLNSSMSKVYDRRKDLDFVLIVNTTDSEGKVDFHPEWRFGS